LVGLALIFTLLAAASSIGQSTRSKSDADINSIGHRKIAQGPNFYSLEGEKQLGNKLAGEIEKSANFITNTEITAYVDKVAKKVEQNSDKHMGITIKLIDSDEAKSFTLPGGHQYITKGLLVRLQNEGELASAIARGVAHTALRSETKITTKSDLTQIATIPITSAGNTGSRAIAVPLTELKERRDSELDADFFGIQYLYKSGYVTQCFLDFVELSGDRNSSVPATFSTVPPLAQRLQLLQKEIAEILPTRNGGVISTSEFQEFKDRIQALAPANVAPPPTKKSN
jgi:predicted Zn-dependent protease